MVHLRSAVERKTEEKWSFLCWMYHNMNKSGVPDRSIGQIRGSRSCHPDLHQPRNYFFVCCWRWKALTNLVTLVPLARERPRREERRTCVKQCSNILRLISSIQIDGTNLGIKLFIHFVQHVEKLSSIQDLMEGEMEILRTQTHDYPTRFMGGFPKNPHVVILVKNQILLINLFAYK